MNLPSVSIIIPTYKRPEFLLRALNSVLGQDYQNIKEIIITDDGDYEESFIEKLKAEDSRIIYVKNTKYAKGPSGNKQNGLDIASGDFIAFMDDDDILKENSISFLINKYKETGETYGSILCNCVRSDNGELTGKHYGKDEELSYLDFLCARYSGEYFGINKREFFEGIKISDEFGGMEGLTWLKIWKGKKWKGIYVHKVLRIYEVFPGQFSNFYEKNAERTFQGYKSYLNAFGEDLKKNCPKRYAYINYLASYFSLIKNDRKQAFLFCLEGLKTLKLFIPGITILVLSIAPIPLSFLLFLKKFYSDKIKKKNFS
ncbi:MAG: glycosyltransferase family 2 protein [Elusimicrobiota bacterium]